MPAKPKVLKRAGISPYPGMVDALVINSFEEVVVVDPESLGGKVVVITVMNESEFDQDIVLGTKHLAVNTGMGISVMWIPETDRFYYMTDAFFI